MTSLTETLGAKSTDCNGQIIGSGYRTIDGSLYLKPYSTISCKVTVK